MAAAGRSGSILAAQEHSIARSSGLAVSGPGHEEEHRHAAASLAAGNGRQSGPLTNPANTSRVLRFDAALSNDQLRVAERVSITAEIETFILEHREHGQLVGHASEPMEHGYQMTITWPCGVEFIRWVTPAMRRSAGLRWPGATEMDQQHASRGEG
jgi:hypothetical protein